ncbi:hypothetical protein WN51_12885, partial [Melipona quadrifasciata]
SVCSVLRDNIVSKITRELWNFRRFENDDFNVSDCKHTDAPMKIKADKLQALLHDDRYKQLLQLNQEAVEYFEKILFLHNMS